MVQPVMERTTESATPLNIFRFVIYLATLVLGTRGGGTNRIFRHFSWHHKKNWGAPSNFAWQPVSGAVPNRVTARGHIYTLQDVNDFPLGKRLSYHAPERPCAPRHMQRSAAIKHKNMALARQPLQLLRNAVLSLDTAAVRIETKRNAGIKTQGYLRCLNNVVLAKEPDSQRNILFDIDNKVCITTQFLNMDHLA